MNAHNSGQIESADIDIRQFMIFTGENNGEINHLIASLLRRVSNKGRTIPSLSKNAHFKSFLSCIEWGKWGKWDYDSGILIVKYPEAALHPKDQRKMAKILVRLVNDGYPVWLSTHSDIMLQQINNLIALGYLPNRTEMCRSMGYGDPDILNPKDVNAYQVGVPGDETKVELLEQIETGFAFPSINEALNELLDETIKLHDLTDTE